MMQIVHTEVNGSYFYFARRECEFKGAGVCVKKIHRHRQRKVREGKFSKIYKTCSNKLQLFWS